MHFISAATLRGQDVLARIGSVDINDDEYCIFMSSNNQAREDNCWYGPYQLACPLADCVQDQVKRHAKESRKHIYTLLLVPRISTLVSRIFEEEGVLGDITISSYNLQFIPLDDDVISLEHENAFKEIWVVSYVISPSQVSF